MYVSGTQQKTPLEELSQIIPLLQLIHSNLTRGIL
jgi:hypothetical protein